MTQPTLFAYLDHNVLDLMTKGDPDGICDLLQRTQLTPVFSNENLAEIQRSTGYEKRFLDVLDNIGARHLVPVMDGGFKYTGSAEIRQISPHDAYDVYVDNVDSLPDSGFGLTGMLQKFYGGRQDQSFSEILSGGADELRQLFQNLEEELTDVACLDKATRLEVSQAISRLPDLIEEQYNYVSKKLDAEPNSAIRQFEASTGIGPMVLKNIKPPEVVRQIWKLVEVSFQGVELDLDTFFGIKPQPFEADANRERTTLEKVNAVYHQLNFLGYYRDSQMSRPRRFVASFSDMTHAGLASFCHILICRDKDLVMKTAAAYEYLEVGTKIMYYGTSN